VHFKRAIDPERAAQQPRLLLVAPMSGHFATLLRGTVETFLPDHEVYITDWQDARDVPIEAGRFDLDDLHRHHARHVPLLGGDVHVFAVCQPSVPVLAATP
jgi:poly(3-hydroxybutyrate) depolymerase